MTPTYLQIFEAIGPYNAIGRVAMENCRALLEANWRVTVVANRLCDELKNEVEWRPLTVPSRGFALKWLSARHFLLQARGHDKFDVIHAHQPQVSDCCDLFQCHFLTRASARRDGFSPWLGRRAHTRIQEEIVLRAEDRFFRRLQALPPNRAPRILFDSPLLRDEFAALYGRAAHPDVLTYAAPPLRFDSAEQRQQAQQEARRALGLENETRFVVGFLGGTHERKGFRRVLQEMQNAPDLVLLFGGPRSDDLKAPELGNRFRNVGKVSDTATFYTACDALVVASKFEPFGLVALEAAACGTPVLATPDVGALSIIEEHGAGLRWTNQNLGELARTIAQRTSEFSDAAAAMARKFARENYHRRLVQECENVRIRNS